MSEDSKLNGLYANCKLDCHEWAAFREGHKAMARDIKNTHALVHEQKSYFNNLEALPEIASILADIKDKLLDVAVGKEQIPLDVAKELFKENKSTSNHVSKTLFIVILGLLSVILFLLTGDNFGWIRELKALF